MNIHCYKLSCNITFCVSFITGSYDRTCKIWDTLSGEELHTLEGHRNVVYAIGFNNPYGLVLCVCVCVCVRACAHVHVHTETQK